MQGFTLPMLPAPDVPDIYEKSAETMNWLRSNIKVGYTTERGPAWWAQGAVTKTGEWTEIPDGSHFEGPVPPEEVRRLLDVRLVKGTVSVKYVDADGNEQVTDDPATEPVVNARTGQVFGYPSRSYTIHPYLETLQGFMERILYDERVGVGSAGLLRKGGVAFLQARLPEAFEVAGYGYQPYATAVTSADQSRSTVYVTGALGAICDNTLDSAVLGALTKLKIRHTRRSMPSVQTAREKLGIQLAATAETIGEAIGSLTGITVSEAEFSAWLDMEVPVPEKDTRYSTGGPGYTRAVGKRDELTRLWTSDPKVQPWTGTAFGVLQAANTYRTWSQTVRGADGARLERNFANDVFGITAKGDSAALDNLAEIKGRTLTLATS